jgi:hypothetical protein
MVEMKGSGKVVEQDPPAGTPIEPGHSCTLRLDHLTREALAAQAPAAPGAGVAGGRAQ